MIDLRSDTVTQPTQEMREAMAHAPVGDDVYGGDPTVKELEREVAALLGTEDAVYVPSGTMSNQLALRSHTEPGDAAMFEQSAHIYGSEGGAAAALSGVLPCLIAGDRGVFTADQIRAMLPVPHRFSPGVILAPLKLLCIENTHNVGGGKIWPLEQIKQVSEAARAAGLKVHLDGARLWNATAATGIPEKAYAQCADSISVCFSKGLGAPVGSALCGPQDFITRARRFKQQFGGGFRQAGIIAAGALFALRNHRARLVEDHANAKLLAEGLAALPGIEIDPATVETNIVRFRVTNMTAAKFVERSHASGVFMLPSGTNNVRALTHLDVTRAQVLQAIEILRTTTAQLQSSQAHAAQQ